MDDGKGNKIPVDGDWEPGLQPLLRMKVLCPSEAMCWEPTGTDLAQNIFFA